MDPKVVDVALARITRKLEDAKRGAELLPTDGRLPQLIDTALSEARRLLAAEPRGDIRRVEMDAVAAGKVGMDEKRFSPSLSEPPPR